MFLNVFLGYHWCLYGYHMVGRPAAPLARHLTLPPCETGQPESALPVSYIGFSAYCNYY
jgi:hypothetical protein